MASRMKTMISHALNFTNRKGIFVREVRSRGTFVQPRRLVRRSSSSANALLLNNENSKLPVRPSFFQISLSSIAEKRVTSASLKIMACPTMNTHSKLIDAANATFKRFWFSAVQAHVGSDSLVKRIGMMQVRPWTGEPMRQKLSLDLSWVDVALVLS